MVAIIPIVVVSSILDIAMFSIKEECSFQQDAAWSFDRCVGKHRFYGRRKNPLETGFCQIWLGAQDMKHESHLSAA